LKEEVVQAFRERFGASPSWVVRSPGRVNLIGEHTDYNDGFVLPMAIDRAIWLAFRPRQDGRVRVYSIDQADPCDFALDDLRQTDAGWAEYPKGMTKMLQDAGHDLVGWEGVLRSALPMGSGLSSSAALEMAVGLAYAAVSDFPFDGMEMARLGQRAENEWVGASTGIMDQMICANGEPGSALLIDCRDLSSQSIVFPESVALLVMDTMTRHDHRTSGYGERRASCEAAASAFGVSHLRDLDLEAFESRAKGLDLDAASLRCARHVVGENARVLEAAEAMQKGDVARLGLLMDACHESLRDDFRVSNEALDTMVSIARAQPGCFGARMTGGGFGGCAIALVDWVRVVEIESVVAGDYFQATDRRPEIFSTKASKGTGFV
jgi:galactokinase